MKTELQTQDDRPVQILIIDDDAALLSVMEAALVDCVERAEVHATPDGAEALELIDTGRFDLVVADHNLGDPRIDGIRLLRRLHDRFPDKLGIIVTAYASLEISIEAIHLGAYDFLTKPFQVEELRLAVRNAIERIRLTRENQELRAQATEMALSMQRLQMDYRDLMTQLQALKDRSPQWVSAGPAGPTLRSGQNKQIQAYLKVGKHIGEQLDSENRRLARLQRRGLIAESPGSDIPGDESNRK
jgi:DNA-binding NtrC family response regulator